MRSSKNAHILIVDDHALLRDGLARFIDDEPGLTVADTAEDAEAALEKLERLTPDLTTIDLSMPGVNGLELIKQVKARYPDVRILVVSMHKETTYAERCLKAGAEGYIMKKEPPDKVIDAIWRILHGEIAVSGKITSQMLRRVTGNNTEPPSVLDTLSDRELEVFELLGDGLGTRQIAEQLHLSIKTIQYYRETIKQKLDLKNAAELTHSAYTWVHGVSVEDSR